MSRSALKGIQAAAGNAGGAAVYVDDVFSTFLYEGTGAALGIQNGINLGDFGVGTSTKFDHNVDFLSRSSDLTSNSDGKTFTFSCWVFLTPKIDDNARTLYATDSNDNGVLFYIQSNNTLGMEAWNGGVRTLQLSTSTVIGTNVWTNILVSLDFANSSNRYIYFNDAAATVTYNTYNNANVEFTRSTHYIGIWGNGSTRGLHNDNLAHMYLDYTYRDLSTESNRRIFIDANGGSTSASSLTALNPIMYIPMTTAYAVGKNAGTGGDFTSNGSPTIVENGTEYVSGNGKGGLVWIKRRSTTRDHGLFDTERGVNQRLYSNLTLASGTNSSSLTAFNSNGFTVGTESDVNGSSETNVSWSFRKQEKFFDIVTYTGTGSAQNISHNLGSVPGMMLVKRYDAAKNWAVYHRSLGNGKYLILDHTNSELTGNHWNNTTPTDSVFSVGADLDTNASGGTYVAYLFAHDAQDFGENSDEAIIKCGNYTGSGSTGKFVDLGFEPQWVLVKNTDAGTPWVIIDTMRGMVVDGDGVRLLADASEAEASSASYFAPRPTGMEVTQQNTYVNTSGQNYVYMAIRRPHKPASEFAATDLFKQNNNTYTTTSPGYVSGFPVDFALQNTVDETGYTQARTRLTGKNLYTPVTDVEAGSPEFDYSTGFMDGSSTNADDYAWMWRRAPGFFDVVAYEGNGSAGHAVTHNLGVAPEMIWVKNRDATNEWAVYSSNLGQGIFRVNTNEAFYAHTAYWNNVTPSSSTFTLGSTGFNNTSSNSYIAYLWASAAGISKVGTYTGTGNDLNVDCGFSAGARFVLIKRSDSSGDWYVWDSERGIVAGNDPYLLLNTTAAQVTGTDYIDPLSSGFTVTSSASAELNASGGTYLFYAIA